MKITIASAMLSTGLLVFTLCNAQAPSGSTGECKDGSYTSAASKSGACSGHGGVKDWYVNTAANATPTPMAPKTAAPAPTPAPATSASAPATKTATAPMAAGGGPGQVWVNTNTKVYHCPGTRFGIAIHPWRFDAAPM